MNTRKGARYQAMAAVVLAVTLAMIAGCGNSGDHNGSGKASGGGNGGVAGYSIPIGTYQSKLGPDQIFFLNFLGNNDIEVTIRDGGRDESYTTTFVLSEDSLIVNIPEEERQDGLESMILKRNGEALEWTIEGMTIAFVKP